MGILSLRGSAERSVAGFSDCKDITTSETCRNLPHRKHPEAVLDKSVNRLCGAHLHSQVCPDKGMLVLSEDSEETSWCLHGLAPCSSTGPSLAPNSPRPHPGKSLAEPKVDSDGPDPSSKQAEPKGPFCFSQSSFTAG